MKVMNNMLINGEWVGASDGARIDIINPATEEVVDSVPAATPADLDKALEAADRAWRLWRETDVWTRSAAIRRVAALIRERAGMIADVMTEEQGKPIRESKAETLLSADHFEWCADEARRIYGRIVDGHSRSQRLLVIRQPVGPVAAFSPWNFPALLSTRKMAPAIAAGCSIIIKPAIEAPRTTILLAQACQDAGIPPGVVNVVTGNSSLISKHLISSNIIRKVSLTGSVEVGKQILKMCADHIKVVSMELGGHSPVLVFDDVDVDSVAETCARGKFRNNGQVCIAASRFYVHEKIFERFVKKFKEVTESLRLGDGRDPKTDIGPLANARRLKATDEFVRDAVDKNAKIICGGRRADEFEKGFFYKPTVLTNVVTSMRLMTEEPFCPIAPITTFTDLEDGLVKANATEFGLAGFVFTKNTKTAFLASEKLDVGLVGVNTLLVSSAEAPFGGVKQSGFGREGGIECIDSYTVTKHINITL